MAILNYVKAKKVMACPGSFALVAEAMLLEKGEETYVTYQLYDTEEFTVAKESLYDYLAEDGEEPAEGVLEEYTKLSEAKKTRYGKVFEMLKREAGKLGSEY